jgi:hypothetical protein
VALGKRCTLVRVTGETAGCEHLRDRDVLADLLRSGQCPVTTLTHIFRQGAGSGIALNARRVAD